MKYNSIKNEDGERIYINPQTGEALETEGDVYIETQEQRLKRQEYFRKQSDIAIKMQMINSKYDEYGSFTWYFYRINEETFPNLSPTYLVRLIYLATYINYDNILRKTLKSFITEKDFPKLLDISEKESKRFITILKRENILLNDVKENQPVLRLNHDLFSKGKLSRTLISNLYENNIAYTRLYADGIRKIYQQTVPSKRKHLGYIFKLLPYTHKQYNIVCYNPGERNKENIQAIPSNDICKLLGYEISHKSRLFKDLLKIGFNSNSITYSIIQYLTYSSDDNIKSMLIINPSIYYAGNEWNKVEVLAINEFKKQGA